MCRYLSIISNITANQKGAPKYVTYKKHTVFCVTKSRKLRSIDVSTCTVVVIITSLSILRTSLENTTMRL